MAETNAPKEPINTINEYMLATGQNLPNHSTSMAGRGKFVKPALNTLPIFRTKQEAYRFAAWLVLMAEVTLPDEAGEHTLEEITEAIRNT